MNWTDAQVRQNRIVANLRKWRDVEPLPPKTPKFFEVHYGEAQWGVQIEAKIKAYDIDDVVQWVQDNYTAYEFYSIDVNDDSQAYMMINNCLICDVKDNPEDYDITLEDLEEYCEGCETSSYFDINETDNPQESLNVIFPTFHSTPRGPMKHDVFHDITK